MRAIRYHRYGPSDVLELEELPIPEPGPGQVLVRVHATSVNPVDTKIRSGGMRGAVRGRPRVPGLDLSGTIEALGPGVRGWSVGDEVFASPDHHGDGTSAQYARVRADFLASKPPSLSHAQAASLPLAGLTAWQCVVEAMAVQADQRVLITAGSGGVGSLAVQLAHHIGATVASTASPRNFQLLTELGASTLVDYHTQRFEEVLEPQDAVLCALDPEVSRAVSVTRRGGRVASITADIGKRQARWGMLGGLLLTGVSMGWQWLDARLHGVRLEHVLRSPQGERLAQLGAIVEQGGLRPVIDRVYPLEDLAEAHAYSESGRATGKIVIEIH